jgi:uncharacterized sulfatase
MKFISRRKRLKEKLILGIKRYLALNVVLFILLVFVRIYEYFYLKHMITLPSGSVKLELYGIVLDILLLFNLAAILSLPFLILYLLSKRLTVFVFGVFIIAFIIIEIALIQFLGTTSLLLGADLFGYTFDEIVKIASAGGGFSFTTILTIVIGISMMITLIVLSKRLKPNGRVALIFLVLCIISLAFRKYTRPEAGKFKSELSYNLTTNKAYHIFSATYSPRHRFTPTFTPV